MKDIFFKSPAHKARFLTALHETGKIDHGRADSEYASALYILSATSELWEKSKNYVRRGIFFAELLKNEHFSSSYSFLVRLAWNLFNGGYSDDDQPRVMIDARDICILDSANFEVAMMAIRLRRDGYRFE